MCIAAPGKIIDIQKNKATVQYQGEKREVMIGDEKAAVGDFVLVQMGIVVKKLTKKEAGEALKAWSTE